MLKRERERERERECVCVCAVIDGIVSVDVTVAAVLFVTTVVVVSTVVTFYDCNYCSDYVCLINCCSALRFVYLCLIVLSSPYQKSAMRSYD